MLFGFFGRSVELKDYLRKTTKIKVNGVRFEIKKIGMEEHLAGLNVIMKTWELYKREKPQDPVVIAEDSAKVKKFMRDFIYAGVVSPKLTLKPEEAGAICIEEILNDMELAQGLTVKIIEFAYGKKKLNT